MLKKNWSTICLVLLVMAAFFARVVYLPDLLKSPRSAQFSFKSLTNPVADWHSWRQADTASVTRELLKGEGSWLVPEYQDLSNIPSGEDNLEGYRMVEFPFYNLISAAVTKLHPAFDVVVASRLVSIIFSLITMVTLYALVKHTSQNALAALLAAAFFGFLPYSIFYSRSILPEPTAVMFSVVSVYSFIRWLTGTAVTKTKNPSITTGIGWYILSLITFAMALLVKPTAIFIAPVFVATALFRYSWKAIMQPLLWLFLVTLVPLAVWRWWIQHYPAGIPASAWLLNGNGIRLRPAWWRWLFADRIARLIFGYWGVVFLAVGSVVKAPSKERLLDSISLSWAVGMGLYLVVFATGNVQHDYYQIIIIPLLALLAGRGVAWLLQHHEGLYRWLSYGMVALVAGLMMLFSWYEVSGYFNINNPAIVEAGKAVDQLTPPNAKIIAPYQGDTAFLFQTNRRGWPLGFELDDKITKGATHYVTTAYDDEARQLEAKYATISKTDRYLLLDLTAPIATHAATTTPTAPTN